MYTLRNQPTQPNITACAVVSCGKDRFLHKMTCFKHKDHVGSQKCKYFVPIPQNANFVTELNEIWVQKSLYSGSTLKRNLRLFVCQSSNGE